MKKSSDKNKYSAKPRHPEADSSSDDIRRRDKRDGLILALILIAVASIFGALVSGWKGFKTGFEFGAMFGLLAYNIMTNRV